jgi:hypothetical protein
MRFTVVSAALGSFVHRIDWFWTTRRTSHSRIEVAMNDIAIRSFYRLPGYVDSM